MAKNMQNRKKAVVYFAVPRHVPRQFCDAPPDESSSLFCQREEIKRKAVELGADIVGEFVIPKPSNKVSETLFRSMLETIRRDAIDYVFDLPGPATPHTSQQRGDHRGNQRRRCSIGVGHRRTCHRARDSRFPPAWLRGHRKIQ
jgi:hypothetical protein